MRHERTAMKWCVLMALLAACGPGRVERMGPQAVRTQVQWRWLPAAPMRDGRIVPTATSLPDGRVLVAGGWLSFGQLLRSAELYDPTTGTFSPTGAMSFDRWYHAATSLGGGRVLVTGGETVGNSYWDTAEIYDAARGTFTPAASMNYPRRTHASVRLSDGRVLVAGGDRPRLDRSAEIYDPASNRWTVVAEMNTSRHYPQGVLLGNGQVLVAGGQNSYGGGPLITDTAEIYDPVGDTWTLIAPMAHPRYAHTATRLLDGRVLVTGGANSYGFYADVIYADAQIYDPATGTWTAPIPMNAARESHTATLLSDGRVVLAGGSGHTSAEIFDPATDTFMPLPSMSYTRVNHAAALLNDGSVLVVGGLAGANNNSDIYSTPPSTSAERLSFGLGCLPPPPGLAVWYPGDVDGHDVIGAHDAAPSNMSFAAGQVDQAFQLRSSAMLGGGTASLTVPDHPDINFDAQRSFTIELWLKFEGTPGSCSGSNTNRYIGLLEKRVLSGGGALGYSLFLDCGRPGLQLAPGGTGFRNYIATSPDLRDGAFHHLAVVVDRASTTGSHIYVDGRAVSLGAATSFNATSIGSLTNGQALMIGAPIVSSQASPWVGLLDELSIYHRALTSTEVAAIYLAGTSGKCLP